MPAWARVNSCLTSPGYLAEEVIGPAKAQERGMKEQLEFLSLAICESSSQAMYIVAIGWLYVVIMMTVTETSLMAGAITLEQLQEVIPRTRLAKPDTNVPARSPGLKYRT